MDKKYYSVLRITLSLFFLFLLFSKQSNAQGIGQWRNHLPHFNVLDITQDGSKIYAATTGGIIFFDKSDNTINRLTKSEGLSGTDTRLVRFHTPTQTLLVVYENTTIDLIKGKRVVKLNDIKNAPILGNKQINEIYFDKNLAYLSTGFAIVVLDIEREEIKDTYFLGPNGGALQFFGVTIAGNRIFAASENGIFEADVNEPFLVDASKWRRHSLTQDSLPSGSVRSLVTFQNLPHILLDQQILKYTNGKWRVTGFPSASVRKIAVSSNNLFLVMQPFNARFFVSETQAAFEVNNPSAFFDANTAFRDSEGIVWVGDRFTGFVQFVNISQKTFRNVTPSSPLTNLSRRISINNRRVAIAPGAITVQNSGRFREDGFFVYERNTWTNYNRQQLAELNPVRDLVVAKFNQDGNTLLVGSYGQGLLEYELDETNNRYKIKIIYNAQNSSLRPVILDQGSIRISGMDYDADGNLWVANYGAANPISMRKPNGDWQSFNFPGVFTGQFPEVFEILVDSFGNKWTIIPSVGILVFDGKGKFRRLTDAPNSGGLPSRIVNDFVEDKDGRVWVVTGQGVAVFNNPAEILTNMPVNAEIVEIVQEGLIQPLLGTENVTAIAVDGANRKWMGTTNGVFLFSDDGQKTILTFKAETSPLISNVIEDIAIDPISGEVYMATNAGLVTYRGTATEGNLTNNDILVYPNPVRPDYTGVIGIKGLVENANVKITDIAGRLIFQTIADGGQAVWDGKSFDGRRASTGVYLVFVTGRDGVETAVTKILFIN